MQFETLDTRRAFFFDAEFRKVKNLSINKLTVFCVEIICTFAVVLKNNKSMKKRTEEEWRRLHENTAAQIIAAKTANQLYSDWSWESIVSDAIVGADTLIKELKKKEERESKQITSE